MAVQWIAFPLHPETPEDGLTLEELFAGRNIDIPAVLERLAQVAAENGLPFGVRERTYNSRRAQELGKWAEFLGRGEEFHQAAFKAYFVDGLNIARVTVLADLAAAVGLDRAEAEAVLAEGRFAAAVDRDWAWSRQCGITAVPTFVAGKDRVVGAQPYGALERLARDAGAQSRP